MKAGRKQKITPDMVVQIRQMLKRYSTRQTAYRMGISQARVWWYSRDRP